MTLQIEAVRLIGTSCDVPKSHPYCRWVSRHESPSLDALDRQAASGLGTTWDGRGS